MLLTRIDDYKVLRLLKVKNVHTMENCMCARRMRRMHARARVCVTLRETSEASPSISEDTLLQAFAVLFFKPTQT